MNVAEEVHVGFIILFHPEIFKPALQDVHNTESNGLLLPVDPNLHFIVVQAKRGLDIEPLHQHLNEFGGSRKGAVCEKERVVERRIQFVMASQMFDQSGQSSTLQGWSIVLGIVKHFALMVYLQKPRGLFRCTDWLANRFSRDSSWGRLAKESLSFVPVAAHLFRITVD